MGPILHGQISKELISSIPINANNPLTATAQLNHSDTKTTLTLPQELLAVPQKPMNMSGSMFSTNLSTNSSTISEGNIERHFTSSGYMSATALLQKAAQMGATVSANSASSPAMMQKSFVTTSMAPSTYDQSSQMMAMEFAAAARFTNQQFMMKKDPQEITSSQFLINADENNNMGMFSGVFDENSGFLKNNMEENNGKISGNNVLHGGDSNVNGLSCNGSEHTMTLDFLGIGRAGKFHEQKQLQTLQQKQQEMGFGVIGHPNLQRRLNQFEKHASLEKHLWEI